MNQFSPLPSDGDQIPTSSAPLGFSSVLELTAFTWTARVVQAPGKVLVCFSASWCKFCREMAPILEEMASSGRYAPVLFAHVNTDLDRDLTRRFRVRGIPQLVLFSGGGVEAHRFAPGAHSEADIARVLSGG